MTGDRRQGRRLVVALAVAAVGLAAIFIAEDLPTRHRVESKLADRSLAALRRDGLTDVTVSFTGRDGTVRVRTAADADRARTIVQDQEGVRVARVIVASAQPASTPPVATPATPPVSTPTPAPQAPTSTPSAPPLTVAQARAQIAGAGVVEFDTGAATLTAASRPVLAKIATILAANPAMKLRIEGHTDSTGPAARNLTLSRQRARAIYDALKKLGVAASRMSMIGYGETRPRVPNTSEHNRSLNRQATFTLFT